MLATAPATSYDEAFSRFTRSRGGARRQLTSSTGAILPAQGGTLAAGSRQSLNDAPFDRRPASSSSLSSLLATLDVNARFGDAGAPSVAATDMPAPTADPVVDLLDHLRAGV